MRWKKLIKYKLHHDFLRWFSRTILCIFCMHLTLSDMCIYITYPNHQNIVEIPLIYKSTFLFPVRPSQLSWKTVSIFLEGVSFFLGATMFQMLNLSEDKTHIHDTHHTTETDSLKKLCLKTIIAWSNTSDDWLTQLDDKGNEKFHVCNLNRSTMFLTGINLYWKRGVLLDKSYKLNCPFNLSNKRSFF